MSSDNNPSPVSASVPVSAPDLFPHGAQFVSPPPLELEIDLALRDPSMYRTSDILECLQLSRSTLYNLIKAREFPPLLRPPYQPRGHLRQIVDAWQQTRMDLRAGMPRLRSPVQMPQWTPDLVKCEHRTGIRMLRLTQVEEMVGLKSTRIYSLIDLDRFPAPAPLTKAARRWVWHEVQDWLHSGYALSLKVSGVRTLPHLTRHSGRQE